MKSVLRSGMALVTAAVLGAGIIRAPSRRGVRISHERARNAFK